MKLDTDRIDRAILGLLHLTLHDGSRAWKSMDWSAMGRLHEKGMISDPASKAKSIQLTDDGLREAERLCVELFAKREIETSAVVYDAQRTLEARADGMLGVLCREAFDGPYFFRTYETDGTFRDYDLRHDELSVTIDGNAMASFYEYGERLILEHNP